MDRQTGGHVPIRRVKASAGQSLRDGGGRRKREMEKREVGREKIPTCVAKARWIWREEGSREHPHTHTTRGKCSVCVDQKEIAPRGGAEDSVKWPR